MRTVVLLLAGCGEMGLDPLDYEVEGPELTVDPDGDIAFGSVSYAGDGASAELTLSSTGDQNLAIVDVYLDDATPLDFSLGSDLPLPIMLAPGEEFVALSMSVEGGGDGGHGFGMALVTQADGGLQGACGQGALE